MHGYNESGGNIYPKRIGSNVDSLGNGPDNAHSFGECKRNAQLLDGPCIDLDGTNQYGVVADDDIFSFGDASTDSPFSIAIKFNADDVGAGHGGLISKMTNTTSGNNEYAIRFPGSGKLEFILTDDQSANRIQTQVITDLVVGTEYEILATYDGSGSENGLTIYVNDIEVSQTRSEVGTYVAMHATATPVEIGSYIRNHASATYHDGKIWDVRIYDSEITPATKDTVAPIWHCPISDEVGIVARDISGNGKDINFVNTPSWGDQDSYFWSEAVGYSLYEHASSADLLVPLKSDGTALTITPPTGYTKTADYIAGSYHNNSQALLEEFPVTDSGSQRAVGYGASFDGATSSHATTTRVTSGLVTDLEIEFDLQIGSAGNNETILGEDTNVITERGWVLRVLSSGAIQWFSSPDGETSDYLRETTDDIFSDDIERHWKINYLNGVVTYVVNGVQIASTTSAFGTPASVIHDGSNLLFIGSRVDGTLFSDLTKFKNLTIKQDGVLLLDKPFYKDSLDRSSNCNHGTDTAITYLTEARSVTLNPTIAAANTRAVTTGDRGIVRIGQQ